ncbi:manganese efflux pump [Paenibacillus alginolyticus]|uniref:Manganese efflux pump n=1 Tax=Paenibacillus alginolyticus TaxID=59839 RepID=A0ABT4G5P9_9BACL|nr:MULTISPECIES: manganese efflux pump [Paenibacillus]MCY9669970.1 manganese efflux pump [Paenibacillus alginolyticus]MCY9691492.1 manganese efflux pump [Paenibacillus alginolyticus]MEC0146602.1 manganese efflux pump [Paenibacillus alginolyticus]NRF93838.1 manganese efflux pump [Paenibacillus frigoriresistens]
MHWFSIIAIGIAANLDNLGIGLSFGARSTKVPLLSNLLIALLSLAATYLAMSAGIYLSHLISPSWGNLIGGFVVVFIGAWGLRSSLKKRRKLVSDAELGEQMTRMAERSDKDGNHIISWGESISLGFALSVNCMASGLAAGVSGVSPLFSALSVGIFSLLTVDIGVRLGSQIAKSWFGKYSELMGCLLLIVIGFYEIFV